MDSEHQLKNDGSFYTKQHAQAVEEFVLQDIPIGGEGLPRSAAPQQVYDGLEANLEAVKRVAEFGKVMLHSTKGEVLEAMFHMFVLGVQAGMYAEYRTRTAEELENILGL